MGKLNNLIKNRSKSFLVTLGKIFNLTLKSTLKRTKTSSLNIHLKT